MPDSVPMPTLAAPLVRRSMYIPSLDGIRAVSFILVFAAHCGFEKIIPGGLGVTVFFFLSGYLITTLLRTEADLSGRISIRDFYIRRVLRIFPPFYLTILFGCMLHWTHVLPGYIGRGMIYQALHMANFWTIHRQVHDLSLDGIALGSNVMWSLAVEEHFYLLFPLLYVLLRKRFNARGQALALNLICGLILLWRCILVYHYHVVWVDPAGDVQNPRTFFGTDTRADSILWGCIFAIACNPMLDRRRLVGLKLTGVSILAVLMLVFSLVYRNLEFRETFRYTLHGLVLFPIFTAAIVYHESPLFRWLNWKPIRHLGVLSYSLYLVHYTVIYVVQEYLPMHRLDDHHVRVQSLLQGVIAFAASFAVSSAIFHFVEKPCARLRKRFSHAGSGKTSIVTPPPDGAPDGIAPLPTLS